MLPSRLFKNTGIPPALRSLITPSPNLPPNIAVQLRFRLGVLPGTANLNIGSMSSNKTPNAAFSSSGSQGNSSPSKMTPPPPPAAVKLPASNLQPGEPTTSSQPLPGKIEPKLSLTFTCTVSGCSTRSTHEFTKQAYHHGIVLVECPGCKTRHLIADHLGWFKEATKDGKMPTVEDLMKAKGEKVRRGTTDAGGVVECTE